MSGAVTPGAAELSSSARPTSSYATTPSRSQSTRIRASAPPPSPIRSTSSYSRPTTAGRPVEEVLPNRDQATSHVNNTSKRISADRAPQQHSEAAPTSTSRPHRTSSRSHSYQAQPDMAGNSSAANGGGPSTAAPAESRHGNGHGRSGKSRTTIPAKTGTWHLGKTIGAGSMGKVKLAKRAEGGEQVAVKIVPRGIASDEIPNQSRADRERAERSKEVRTAREAAIVSLLDHPYICGMRDVVRTNFHWYMLFEYVNGGQMLDYIISHGRLKEKQARKFSRQIASALDYCHRNSIVHRDLKIENILISKVGDIKIIDFGLSNLFAPKSHLSTFCGSLYFAAPELLQAKPYTGPEVDIWSFGIVLYVLVCGKVPFDDQSMPALHTKIKKGLVDYPSWLSAECKHLISRMLVTDPSQRATLSEIMNHSWMIKGFGSTPENYLPVREPLSLPLDPNIIDMMTGFDFGSPETITGQLNQILSSEDYRSAVASAARDREAQQPRDGEKKRGFGFDFYKRRNSVTSKDNLSTPSADGIQLGLDPVNAFHPLISVYYLCMEKAERDRNIENPGATSIPRAQGEAPLQMAVPTAPKAAHTNASKYEMPGENATGGRSRPRARTHGEEEIAEGVKNMRVGQPPVPAPTIQHDQAPPPARIESRTQELKKESTATSLFRKFSTRTKRKDPEKSDRGDKYHPPVVTVQEPQSESANPSVGQAPPPSLRKSFSVRRTRDRSTDVEQPEQNPSLLRSGSSSRPQRDMLTPPRTADNTRSNTKALGRSTSVNSADFRRRKQDADPMPRPHRAAYKDDFTSTNDSQRSMERDEEHKNLVNGKTRDPQGKTELPSRAATMRAKSLGHARRESIQARRAKREEAREAMVPEEPRLESDDEDANDHDRASVDKDHTAENAKPVYLKGLFSVSTTSTKPVQAIRLDIIRVLQQLGINFTEIRSGFRCHHSPSIDLKRSQDHGPQSPPFSSPSHRRKISFFGNNDRDEFRESEYQAQAQQQSQNQNYNQVSRSPPVPRTPGRNPSGNNTSFSNSDASDESVGAPAHQQSGYSRRVAGETSTHVQNDVGGGDMALEFEIFVVKIPLLSLHGVQFKRLAGGTWQYKNMADQILKELHL